jgi:type I restriction enzyme M protein
VRFNRGKKADLMFVQHMVASLKAKGHMATIMPPGVLFRDGMEFSPGHARRANE